MVPNEEAANTPGKKELFLEALESTRGMIAPAADRVGISRSIVYAWMKSDTKFQRRVKAIQKMIPQLMEERLAILGYEGDLKAVIYFLERNHAKYRKKNSAGTEAHIYHHVEGRSGRDGSAGVSLEDRLYEIAAHKKKLHDEGRQEELRDFNSVSLKVLVNRDEPLLGQVDKKNS